MKSFYTSISCDYIRLLLGQPDQWKPPNNTSIWREEGFQIESTDWQKLTMILHDKGAEVRGFFRHFHIRTPFKGDVIEVAISLLGDQCREEFHSPYPSSSGRDDCTWLSLYETSESL